MSLSLVVATGGALTSVVFPSSSYETVCLNLAFVCTLVFHADHTWLMYLTDPISALYALSLVVTLNSRTSGSTNSSAAVPAEFKSPRSPEGRGQMVARNDVSRVWAIRYEATSNPEHSPKAFEVETESEDQEKQQTTLSFPVSISPDSGA